MTYRLRLIGVEAAAGVFHSGCLHDAGISPALNAFNRLLRKGTSIAHPLDKSADSVHRGLGEIVGHFSSSSSVCGNSTMAEGLALSRREPGSMLLRSNGVLEGAWPSGVAFISRVKHAVLSIVPTDRPFVFAVTA